MLRITIDMNKSSVEATEKGSRLITECVYAAVGLSDVIKRITGLSKADSAEFLAFSVKAIDNAGLQKYSQDITAAIPEEVLNRILNEEKGAGEE